jgi:penicillin-insensitive murein endopeptidase
LPGKAALLRSYCLGRSTEKEFHSGCKYRRTKDTKTRSRPGVGKNEPNQRDDVLLIQRLLNKHGAKLKEDRYCGPNTVAAIMLFQKSFMTVPDGRINPNGTTWRHLTAGEKPSPLVPLPKAGTGYYRYSPSTNQYGTRQTIDAVTAVAAAFAADANAEIGVGDISLANGGHLSPHKSHRRGTNVDMRPLRSDKKRLPVSITDDEYSCELTRQLIEKLLANSNVRRILFNDKGIHGVHFFQGHHNHLHVEMNR